MRPFRSDEAFLIISDMEGVSGLVDDALLSSGGRFWRNYGRYLLTWDVNAAAMALFSRGIKRIYLSENHNLGRNTVPEELLPFIDVLPPHSANTSMRGTGFWEELYTKRNIMGAILVGFPGMAGSGGFKSHSWDSNIFEYIRVNGREAGSITMTAGLLGEYGIPVAAIIGDEAAAREMRLVDPNIIVVTVKKMAENG